MTQRLVLALTGASSAGYAVALLERLSQRSDIQVTILSSKTARQCLDLECGKDVSELAALSPNFQLEDETRLDSPMASGSHLHQGMVIVPCSMGSLARITSGISDSLITRAADVTLKERRPLILCVRESPLNRIHLDNMLKAHDAGACIMPLTPGFYTKPQSIPELLDTFATRILDQLGIIDTDAPRWGRA